MSVLQATLDAGPGAAKTGRVRSLSKSKQNINKYASVMLPGMHASHNGLQLCPLLGDSKVLLTSCYYLSLRCLQLQHALMLVDGRQLLPLTT